MCFIAVFTHSTGRFLCLQGSILVLSREEAFTPVCFTFILNNEYFVPFFRVSFFPKRCIWELFNIMFIPGHTRLNKILADINTNMLTSLITTSFGIFYW